ncbi:dirigent protein 1-like [Sesamum indicum]|uniref:Dirigent protein n=1 Tax=Sesamum indicum TaxID=4182 RepID=A0A6I9U5Q2_SESIN|nr:dirigent protein 1-like [Sesamum indicum]
MGKLTIALMLGALAAALMNMLVLGSNAEVQRQRLNSCLGKERLTRLRFYLQDLVGGENKTVWRVAQCNLTDVLPSEFGTVSVLDNLVTTGPEIDSQEVGRMQGLIGLADLHEMALAMLLNIVFTEGEYKGSTLSILGRNNLYDEIREVPIVGGTGAFRMARGYVITRTYSTDETHFRSVYEYDLVIFHMDEDNDVTRLNSD